MKQHQDCLHTVASANVCHLDPDVAKAMLGKLRYKVACPP